uniref:Uncharacterized protein n=1 Tax=Aegilops tauschii TaxID=37682 RepID=R7WC84_AEGTA
MALKGPSSFAKQPRKSWRAKLMTLEVTVLSAEKVFTGWLWRRRCIATRSPRSTQTRRPPVPASTTRTATATGTPTGARRLTEKGVYKQN